jgi:hypothetical protein
MLTLEKPAENASPRVVTLLVLVAMAVVAYFGLLSTNYDPNGLTEIRPLGQSVAGLFTPNHMLYRILVLAFYELLQLVGYAGTPLLPAQCLTAASGAIGVGLFYLWLRKCGIREAVAILATFGFGASWSYWVFSIDVYYVTPSAAAVLGAVNVLTSLYAQPDPLRRRAVGLAAIGVLNALAILFWQANIFLVPVILIALFFRFRSSRGRGLGEMALYLVSMGLLVSATYFVVGVLVLQNWPLDRFVHWFTSYSAQLPIWGRLEPSRITSVIVTATASLVPVWEGLGLRSLMYGVIEDGKLLPQLSLLALIILILVPTVLLVVKRKTLPANRLRLLGLIMLGYWIFVPFNTWWDPFEPKWFVVPNIALWAALAIAWDLVVPRLTRITLLPVIVVVIASANLVATIWPRHAQPDANLQTATCIATSMQQQDLFVSTDIRWGNDVGFFGNRATFDLVANVAYLKNKPLALQNLCQEITKVSQAGGSTYVLDLNTYSQDEVNWLKMETNLSDAEIGQFSGAPAFTCAAQRFVRIERPDFCR